MIPIEMISVILGIAIGSVLALTGAGGAMLAIPLLVFFLPISIYQAAPIALLAIFIASSIGAIQGLRNGIVRYKTAALIGTTGIFLAPFGVKLAQHSTDTLLSFMLMCILLVISITSWLEAKKLRIDNTHLPPPACMLNPATSKLFWTAPCTKKLIRTGALTGFLSGLLGVGGGFVIVPSLHKVTNFSHQSVVATTLAAVSLISASSITSHLHSNSINWHIALPFATGTTLSMLVTNWTIGQTISKPVAKQGFAILCLIAALHLAKDRLI